MTMLAGIDLSTRRLDAAIIPLDPDTPQTITFRTEHLPKTIDEGTRYRDIHNTTQRLLRPQERPPTTYPVTFEGKTHQAHYVLSGAPPALEWDITSCWVEQPRGPHAVRQLSAAYGAVMASIPPHITRAALDPQEWRLELGLPKSLPKPEAIQAACDFLSGGAATAQQRVDMDEHQAEALLIAIAGRNILCRHHDHNTAA